MAVEVEGPAFCPLAPTEPFGRSTLAANNPNGVQLPVDDVRQRVLDRPWVACLGPRHRPLPIVESDLRDQRVQRVEFSLGPPEHFLPAMAHSQHPSHESYSSEPDGIDDKSLQTGYARGTMDFSRRHFLVLLGQWVAVGGTGLLAACQGQPESIPVTSAPAAAP